MNRHPFTPYMASLIALLLFSGIPLVSADGPWKQAAPGYQFSFPRDHGSHPDYRIEWWYYTGNLSSRDGQHFGYQLTFFRVGIDPRPSNPSKWAVRDLHMAHFAITDISANSFHYFEKLNREGIGWAGASTGKLEAWNETWRTASDDKGVTSIHAEDGRYALELSLSSEKPPALHGLGGLSQKGTAAGNSSQYYSQTRMPSKGILTIDGRKVEVEGLSWMDHEFGTSFLEKEQQGWDWFAIQLDDGTELMLYRFRRRDGSPDIHSNGSLIEKDGTVIPLGATGFKLESQATWTSKETGARYPIRWRVSLPTKQLLLEIECPVQNNELLTARSTGVIYWEGPIKVSGTRSGSKVSGQGYLEMTGYAGPAMGAVFE